MVGVVVVVVIVIVELCEEGMGDWCALCGCRHSKRWGCDG